MMKYLRTKESSKGFEEKLPNHHDKKASLRLFYIEGMINVVRTVFQLQKEFQCTNGFPLGENGLQTGAALIQLLKRMLVQSTNRAKRISNQV